MTNISVLPGTGYITVSNLAKFLGTSDDTVIQGLTTKKVQILKIGRQHKTWLVPLDRLIK